MAAFVHSLSYFFVLKFSYDYGEHIMSSMASLSTLPDRWVFLCALIQKTKLDWVVLISLHLSQKSWGEIWSTRPLPEISVTLSKLTLSLLWEEGRGAWLTSPIHVPSLKLFRNNFLITVNVSRLFVTFELFHKISLSKWSILSFTRVQESVLAMSLLRST